MPIESNPPVEDQFPGSPTRFYDIGFGDCSNFPSDEALARELSCVIPGSSATLRGGKWYTNQYEATVSVICSI